MVKLRTISSEKKLTIEWSPFSTPDSIFTLSGVLPSNTTNCGVLVRNLVIHVFCYFLCYNDVFYEEIKCGTPCQKRSKFKIPVKQIGCFRFTFRVIFMISSINSRSCASRDHVVDKDVIHHSMFVTDTGDYVMHVWSR